MIDLTPWNIFWLGLVTGQLIGFACSVIGIKYARWKIANQELSNEGKNFQALEGEEVLRFFDSAGSGWIREEFFPETIPLWRRLLRWLKGL